jgi:hypothetical protein
VKTESLLTDVLKLRLSRALIETRKLELSSSVTTHVVGARCLSKGNIRAVMIYRRSDQTKPRTIKGDDERIVISTVGGSSLDVV